MICVGFGMQAAKPPTYPDMWWLSLFVTLCDHNPIHQCYRWMSCS